MSFIVRSAGSNDALTIIEFNRRLALETEGKTLDHTTLAAGVASVLADANRGRYFVADDGGTVIGQIMITYEWSDWRNGWIWWLQSVYVAAAHRRRGIFRAIFEYLVEVAKRERDVVGLRLYVERENSAAQDTYQRLGFEDMHFFLFNRAV